MKVLVLSCNTGQGHNTAGKAIQEEFLCRGVECDIVDALAFGGATFTKGTSFAYNQIVVKTPKLFGFGYRVCGAISTDRVKSPAYLVNKLYRRHTWRYIVRGGYDTLVMPHVFPAQTITSIRRHYPLDAGCYNVSTDYTDIPFLEDLDVDAIFVPHEQLMPDFEARDIRSPLVATGIPVSARFLQHKPQEEARTELGLPLDVPVYLLMSGSMGFGNLTDLIRALLKRGPKNAHLVVMGGNNEALKADLRREFAGQRVTVLDFTDKVSDYMDAADVLFTKPGGLTTTEAAVKTIALVHTAPIPGVESANAAFFSKNKLSVTGDNLEELLHNAMPLLESEKAREEMRARQAAFIHRNSAAEICDYIEADYQKRRAR
ncbi:MAG: glycosyl transferase [Clostridia bacterium]|nr:glycosyl transferase [Clostridia bacterium]